MSRSIAAAGAAALMALCAAAEAGSDAPSNPSFLLFAGSDLWRDGAFADGGLLWSPAGLDAQGFTLKVLLSGGLYVYPSAGLRTDVDGTLVSAAALPGWRATHDGLTIGLYAGPLLQDYRLSPYDPGARLHGLYGGGQVATDAWYQPSTTTMMAFDGSIASIAAIGSARAAVGWRLFESGFVGPETQGLWAVDYQQWRLGAHITGLRIDALEWSTAGGWAVDSFRRGGPYLRMGMNARY